MEGECTCVGVSVRVCVRVCVGMSERGKNNELKKLCDTQGFEFILTSKFWTKFETVVNLVPEAKLSDRLLVLQPGSFHSAIFSY